MGAKNKKKFVRHGLTFRRPNGSLSGEMFDSARQAQAAAAFESDRRYSHIIWPDDWNRAYSQGFRIVPVTLRAGATKKEWAKPASDRKEAK